jgi:hypothetical protein
MQGSNILDGFSKKMIKEDHYLACTTKMFEIQTCATPAEAVVTTWIA